MTVNFELISRSLRVPLFYVEVGAATRVSAAALIKPTLYLGQMLPTGVAKAEELVLVTSASHARRLFGEGSQLAASCAAFFAAHPTGELWSVPLADADGGTQAASTITVSGPATAAGTINLYIAGALVRVSVSGGDSAGTIASAIADAISVADEMPVTASAAGAVVTCTARHKGTVGNQIDIRDSYYGAVGGEELPAGVSLVYAKTTQGATDPDVGDAIAVLSDEAFDTWCVPWTTASQLNACKAELDRRWGPEIRRYGHVFAALEGSVGSLQTFGATRNSAHETVMGFDDSPTPAYVWSGALAGVAARVLGADPALPLQTERLPGVLAPPPSRRFTLTERNTLLGSGVATFAVVGNEVLVERAITTYQTDAAAAPDDTWLDVQTPYTLARMNRRWEARIVGKFSQHKLVDDATPIGPGQRAVSAATVKAEIVAEYSAMVDDGIAEDVAGFKASLVCERDATNPNRLNALVHPDVANQFRIFAMRNEFIVQPSAPGRHPQMGKQKGIIGGASKLTLTNNETNETWNLRVKGSANCRPNAKVRETANATDGFAGQLERCEAGFIEADCYDAADISLERIGLVSNGTLTSWGANGKIYVCNGGVVETPTLSRDDGTWSLRVEGDCEEVLAS